MQIGNSTVSVLQPPVPTGAAWVLVHVPDSGLGDLLLTLGPGPVMLLTPELLSAADERVRSIATAAMAAVAQALASNPKLCSRCARTLMRAAMGSQADRDKVSNPTNGDDKRYMAAWQALEPQIRAARRDTELLSAQIQQGDIGVVIQQAAQSAAARNPYGPMYESAGWPMQAGQWGDYKACACGEPGTGQQPVQMAGALPSGACSCGCGGSCGGNR
jgi:hypothetical protein